MPIDQRLNALWPTVNSNPYTVANGTLNLSASNSAMEYIFQALSTEPITHVGFYCAAIVGTTPNYKASIQGVNTAGTASAFPNGTIKGGVSPASKVINPSALGWTAGTFKWVALDNAYTPAVGELLSYVLTYDSGTIDAANYLRTGDAISNLLFGQSLPRGISNSAGTRTHRTTGVCSGGWRTESGRYGCGGLVALLASGSASLTSEQAIKFTVPSSISSTRLVAINLNPAFGDPSSNWTLKGYAGGNVTDTTAAWTDTIPRYVSPFNGGIVFYLASPWTLTGGSTYRVSLSSSGQTLVYADVTEVEDWGTLDTASPWSTAGICYSTRSGGNWTDTLTRRPQMNLWFDNTTYAGGGAAGFSLSRLINLGG